MRAILLAAGPGIRLRPITDTVPKCMVPIHGKVLLDYWIEQLIEADIERILINTHYMHGQVEQHVMNSEFHEFIDLIHEENLLLTGGTVLANKDYFRNETFMLAHADNLSICDYKDFITSHYSRPEGTVITMMTYLSDNPESCGIIEIDEFGVVQKFHEKVQIPPSNIANAAVYIVEPSIIDFMTKLNKQEIDFSTEVIPAFLGGINTYHNDVYHRDIGTVESYCLSQIEYYKMSVKDVDVFE